MAREAKKDDSQKEATMVENLGERNEKVIMR